MSVATLPDVVAPAYLSVPERAVDTFGRDAVDLVAVMGLTLDPEQVIAVEAIMSVDENDLWAGLEAAIIEARQNGKTGGVLLPVALAVALLTPDQLIVWSAHRYKTSSEAFLLMLKLYRSCPELAQRIAKVTYSNGEEAFEFTNGSRIVFIARSQASGRGLTGDLVILDEALFVTAEMMGALMPTLSARPNPMVLYASSAGLSTSTVLADVRDRGRAGGDPSLVYVEWAAPEGGCESRDCDHNRDAVGCALDDRRNWQLANHALGRRITERYVAAERRTLKPSEFARERLGWWDKIKGGTLFHLPSWWRLRDDASTPGELVVFAAHVTPDRRAASVVVASLRGDGVTHIEVVAHGDGVSWVVPWLVERAERHSAAAVVLAGSMAAGSLVPELEDVDGFKAFGPMDVRRACAAFYDAVTAGTIATLTSTELDAAVAAVSRSSGRGEWVFDAPPEVDLSPLYGAALALWACRDNDYDVMTSVY